MGMILRRYKSVYIKLLSVALLLLGLHFWSSYGKLNLTLSEIGFDVGRTEQFYSRIFDLIEESDPKCPLEKEGRYLRELKLSGANKDQSQRVIHSEEELGSLMNLTEDFIHKVKKSHDDFLSSIPKKLPSSFYEGQGIVYVGGGKYTWLSLLNLKTLRDRGTTVPVEIVLPDRNEYEIDLCERFLTTLNAKCVLLEDAFGKEVMDKHIFKGYQYKGLAALASSFEKVLMLDSDNTPVTNIDYLFESEVFEKNGLILWPDFWERSTNPNFYNISGIEIGDRVRYIRNPFLTFEYEVSNLEIPLHQREGTIPDGSSESGQVLINKKTHGKALLLSLFYNYYGPDYFYPLLSQGAPGEGDKETFIAAAHKLGLPYYQVYRHVGVLGYFSEGSKFQGTGMVQYDPVQDYNNILEFVNENEGSLRVKNEAEAKDLNSKFEDKIINSSPRPILAHMNYPKLYPHEQLGGDLDDGKKKVRIYSANPYDFDLEDVLWRNVRYLLCEDRIKDLKYVESIAAQEDKDVFMKSFCKKIDDHIYWLRTEESLKQIRH